MRHNPLGKTLDPYRILFPLGSLMGLLGITLWLSFQYKWISFYPRTAHFHLMFFSMLWAFVAGFLMTAIPKMTQTFPANKFELGMASALPVFQGVLGCLNFEILSVILFGIQQIFLITFILRRFLIRKKVPFAGFYFIPVAFMQSLLGVIIFFVRPELGDKSVVLLCGEAFILNLILGIGSRLIPAISRLPNALLPTEEGSPQRPFLLFFVLGILNLGYWLGLSPLVNWGLPLRALASVVAVIGLLKIFIRPLQWSITGVSLKMGALLLAAGQILTLSVFDMGVAAMHLTYIGGFLLITFMISTRVMLAHGGESLNFEVASPMLGIMSLSFVLAGLMRLGAGNNFTSPWILGSILFIMLAISLWTAKFFSISNQNKSSC